MALISSLQYTEEIDYCMKKLQKVIRNKMELENKTIYFRWISNLIAMNREETSQVKGTPSMSLQKIVKQNLNFEAKDW